MNRVISYQVTYEIEQSNKIFLMLLCLIFTIQNNPTIEIFLFFSNLLKKYYLISLLEIHTSNFFKNFTLKYSSYNQFLIKNIHIVKKKTNKMIDIKSIYIFILYV